ITVEQMRKLLNEGKTDLLDGFVSNRTNRKFKAFLTRDATGKVGFEFEARPTKKATKKAAKKASTKTATAKKATAKKAATKKTAAKKALKKAANKTTTES